MFFWRNKTVLKLTLLMACLIWSMLSNGHALANGLACEIDNDALRDMGKALVSFTRADGSEFEVSVKLADNNQTRAAGFQRVCASTIEAEPILFVFKQALKPQFHMNNVVAPIDIAFIDKTGAVDSIQSMQPYVLISKDKPLYGSNGLVIAALEVHPGFFAKYRLGQDSVVTWQRIDK